MLRPRGIFGGRQDAVPRTHPRKLRWLPVLTMEMRKATSSTDPGAGIMIARLALRCLGPGLRLWLPGMCLAGFVNLEGV